MTGEEMERAIEFLLQNQAKFDTLLEQMARRGEEAERQLAETNRQLQITAETQSEFIQIVTNAIQALKESQDRMDERLTRNDERLSERFTQNDERLSARIAQNEKEFRERIAQLDEKFNERVSKTDERLNRLADLVERHISEGRGGGA